MEKTILFLGDSITAGVGASEQSFNYVELIGKRLGVRVLNYGTSGTRIADEPGEPKSDYFLARAKRMPQDADFVFVFGGTNDYGHGLAELGDLTDKTDYTFCGALNNLVVYLVEKHGKEKLCFILPLHRYNEKSPFGDGSKKRAVANLQEYRNIMLNTLRRFEINFVDFDKEIPEPSTKQSSTFFVDGLHPNDHGHRAIADKLIGYLYKIYSDCK